MSEDAPETVCAELIRKMQSLQLSTVNPEGLPDLSYTPYLHRPPNHFYIFVSQLAAHTRHMLGNPTVSIMVIADEHTSRQIFARTRVMYQCEAIPVSPDASNYTVVLDGYQQRHGKTVALLRQLPDFLLFHLRPVSGRFVMGFGKAYLLTGEDLSVFEPVRSG
ncbi:MAG: pyridoxamine 5'-phosphate oxidase family protein [Nitrospirales bacterium]|nr:pyridoxamine 5'-phosphate oxidase family protein [Nitrospira sp.]MDR4503083.1 pyridoxamine 5'-phosphate oxidase family protein [Nitrospirales bacterium]